MRKVMIASAAVALLVLLSCKSRATKAPDPASDLPMSSILKDIKAHTAQVDSAHLKVSIDMDRGEGCTQPICLQVIPSKHGPGFRLPKSGTVLLSLGSGGTDGFVVFDFEGEDIKEIHVFEAEQRKELDPKMMPAVMLVANQRA